MSAKAAPKPSEFVAACFDGSVTTVTKLLAAKADPNAKDKVRHDVLL